MDKHRLEDLVWRYVEGIATPVEFNELNAMLKSDEEALPAALRVIQLHTHIRTVLKPDGIAGLAARGVLEEAAYGARPEGVEVSATPLSTGESTFRRRLSARWRVAVVSSTIACSALLALVGANRLWAPGATDADGDIDSAVAQNDPAGVRSAASVNPGIATITGLLDVTWSQDPSVTEFGYGAVLTEGSVCRLRDGLVQLTFEGGAKVLVQGPAEFGVESTMRSKLTRGKLTAVIPEEATGFTVSTPFAEIIDLGTEFGVDVDADDGCDVHVFDGELIAFSAAGGNPAGREPYRLVGQQAAAFSRARPSGASTDFNHRKFVRELEPRIGLDASERLPVSEDLALWLSAGFAVQRTDANEVVSWGDILIGDNQSSEDATQTYVEARPAWVRDGIDGQPSVRFGGDQYLVTARFENSANQTVVVVLQYSDDPLQRRGLNGQVINYNGPPNQTSINLAACGVLQIGELTWGPDALSAFVFSEPGGTGIWTGRASTEQPPADTPTLLTYVYDYSGRRASLYVNGQLAESNPAVVSAGMNSRKVIGRHAILPRFFRGDIGELVVFNRALPTEDRQELEAFLLAKYRIAEMEGDDQE